MSFLFLPAVSLWLFAVYDASPPQDWLSAQDPAQITSRSARVRNIGEEGWSEMTDPVTGARFYHNDILDEVRAGVASPAGG